MRNKSSEPTIPEKEARAALSPEQIKWIFDHCLPSSRGDSTPNEFSYKSLAVKFGVRWQVIAAIHKGLACRDITGATDATRFEREPRPIPYNKHTVLETTCRRLLTAEQIKWVYENAQPSKRGGDPKSHNPNGYRPLGRMLGVPWEIVMAIHCGQICRDITGAKPSDAHTRRLKIRLEQASKALTPDDVRLIRTMARVGPLSDKAPYTYASLAKRYGISEECVKYIWNRTLRAEVPDLKPKE